MKAFKSIFGVALIALIMGFIAISYGASANNTAKTAVYSSPTKPILVSSSKPEFTLKLSSNQTTGYSWFLMRYNKALISPVKHEYIGPKSDRIGAGGYELWTFKVSPKAFTVPQILKVKMLYTQPWNMKEGKSVSFKIVTHKD